MAKFKRHPRWNELLGVVGYVDSNGAVHAKIRFMGDPDISETHAGFFPNKPKYKTWRWNKQTGIVQSQLCTVDLDKHDYEAVRNWLYKHGCLANWELD